MTFQTTVYTTMAEYQQGQFLNASYMRYGRAFILNSDDADDNIPGRVFTYVDKADVDDVQIKAGGELVDGIAGVVIGNPQYRNYGTTGNPFGATLALKNGEQVTATTIGSFVSLVTADVDAGDPVYYTIADGSIYGADDNSGAAAFLPNAEFVRAAAAGTLAEIVLNSSVNN